MPSIEQIASVISPICYKVDRIITGLSEQKATAWAKVNSLRHARTIDIISRYQQERLLPSLKILNASGMACGHQDFSIVSYLKKELACPVNWKAFDTPNNQYITHPLFSNFLKELEIELSLKDFAKCGNPFNNEIDCDVIVFTEIAEHLEHGTLLKVLCQMRECLVQDGILILTTPNLTSIRNRIKMVLGKGDLDYWGDGVTNYKAAIFGHIVYYDVNRMSRLLEDCGYEIITRITVSNGDGNGNLSLMRRVKQNLLSILTAILPNSGDTVLITAKKSHTCKSIPFQT